MTLPATTFRTATVRTPTGLPEGHPHDLAHRYLAVRSQSAALVAPLSAEDFQSMPDASPAKWHLAHTT